MKEVEFFSFLNIIEVQLIYNIALISAVEQSDSVLHIYTLFHILFHYDLSQDIEYSSLCYTGGFPSGSVIKKISTCNAGGEGSIPWS